MPGNAKILQPTPAPARRFVVPAEPARTPAAAALAQPAPAIPARRKLLPIVFVTVFTGLDEDQVLALVENGKLWPAWNIALHPARPRREIRIWREAVIQYQASAPAKSAANLEYIITAALPPLGLTKPSAAEIRATEISYRLCASDLHIANLMAAGQLREAGKRATQTAPRRISYASAADFLQRRVLA